MRTRPDGDRDRGQLLLIAGLGIAVAFVALALVVNSAVFAQTLSTRPGPNGAAAVQYQQEATQGVGGIVSEANAHDYASAGSLAGTVGRSATDWNNLTASEYGAHGTLTNASVVATVNGTSLHQATPRAFTDRHGSADWSLFSNANGVRRFRMNVTTTGPATTPANALTVTFRYASHADRTVAVYRGGTSTNPSVVVNGSTTCEARAPTTVDFSNASLGSKSCSALDVLGVGTVKQVHISHGDNATGRYVALVNATPENLYPTHGAGSHFYTADGVSPSALHAVYAARLNVSYRSPRVTYGSTVTVTPGITPGTGRAGTGGRGGGRVGAGSPRYGVVSLQDRLVFSYANTPKNLSTIDAVGAVTRYRPTNPQVIGPRKYDLTGDGVRDTPYVDSAGAVHLANASGSTVAIATGADHTKSLLAVGSWNGSAPSVFYTGTGNTIYRVRPDGTAVPVASDTNSGVGAVVGIGDVTGNGKADLVYLGGSQHLRYFDQSGGHHEIPSGGVGQSNGVGAGAPVDIGGVTYVPMVDGSNNLYLINAHTKRKVLSGNVDESPVAAFDANGNGRTDLVYLNNGQIWYASNVTGTATRHTFENASGKAITASGQTGVA